MRNFGHYFGMIKIEPLHVQIQFLNAALIFVSDSKESRILMRRVEVLQ